MTVSLSATLSSFYFLLLFLLFQLLYGQVYATKLNSAFTTSPTIGNSGGAQQNNIELFKTGNLEILLQPNSNTQSNQITVNNYYSPVIVVADDNILLALTGVNRTSKNTDNEKNITIVTKYIEIKKEESDWGKNILSESTDESNGKWKSQFAVRHEIKNIGEKTLVVKGLLAVANDKKIYVLLVNCSNKNDDNSNNDAKCDLNITVGSVGNGDTSNNKKITWSEEKINNYEDLLKNRKGEKSKFYPYGGTAFVTNDKKVVFVVLIVKEENKKNIFAVIFSEGDGKTTEFKVSKEESADGCALSFFPWGENKIIMVPTDCSDDGIKTNQKVKESSDLGGNWSESAGPFACLLGFMQDKNNFTATKINNTSVLLFTQKRSIKTEDSRTKNETYVWFTDGNRVHSAGPIVTDDNITSASLLHTKGELFALHQNWENTGQQKNITLTRMKEQLNKIVHVIDAWDKTNGIVKEWFKNVAPLSPTFSATDGLVGFLSNKSSEKGNKKEWIDEYYYVNATVDGEIKVDNGGFKFGGKGAKWPVGKNKEEQPYNFTDSGFTLVANVTIDVADASDKSKDNSVLGVVYSENGNNDDDKRISLWCTADGEWKVTGNNDKLKNILSDKVRCQQGSAYLVALILNDGECFVHIDGEKLGVKEGDTKIKIEKKCNITHFYFGTYESNNDESHITVTNAFLYNRPLKKEEIEKLTIPKKEIIKHQTPSGGPPADGPSETPQLPEDANSENNNGNNEEEKTSSPSQPESSTVCGGVSGMLIVLLLLGLHGCYLQ